VPAWAQAVVGRPVTPVICSQMVKRMVISAHAWARRYQRGLSPSLFYVCDERHRERSVSLMHCYQREFFNETERHQWRTAWRSSLPAGSGQRTWTVIDEKYRTVAPVED
jgi:hypothetical protein